MPSFSLPGAGASQRMLRGRHGLPHRDVHEPRIRCQASQSSSSQDMKNRRAVVTGLAGLPVVAAAVLLPSRGDSKQGSSTAFDCASPITASQGPDGPENMAVLMDASACMSTLYAHASQYLREVRFKNTSAPALPQNASRASVAERYTTASVAMHTNRLVSVVLPAKLC